MTNPFSPDTSDLLNFATGVVLPGEIADALIICKWFELDVLEKAENKCLHSSKKEKTLAQDQFFGLYYQPESEDLCYNSKESTPESSRWEVDHSKSR